jgi:hypothetical protein
MFTVTHPHPQQDNPKVTLQGITWQTYQSLVQDLEFQPAKRLTYDNGMLEIFKPLPVHCATSISCAADGNGRVCAEIFDSGPGDGRNQLG